MKNKILFYVAGVLLLASSCTSVRKNITSAPVNAQVNLTMADMEYLGEVTGTATQSYILGFIPVGGRRYYQGMATSQFGINPPQLRGENNAIYDALNQKPDADFVLPFATEKKINFMFLGRKETVTVRAKAFRLRVK